MTVCQYVPSFINAHWDEQRAVDTQCNPSFPSVVLLALLQPRPPAVNLSEGELVFQSKAPNKLSQVNNL